MATNPVSSTDNPASSVFSSINGTKKAASGANAVTEQQNRFLTLLTTQLKNQDPLNPMDNAQMTSQMAQISTVDGIERLNATLQTLINSSSQTQTLQAAAIVGHGVLVPGSSMTLANGGAVAGFELAGPADSVQVDIKDANGLLVRTLRMGGQEAGTQAFAWDGQSDAGAAAVDGAYTFTVSAKQGEDKVKVNALNYGMVDGVVNGAKGISVDVGRLGTFGMTDVKQIM